MRAKEELANEQTVDDGTTEQQIFPPLPKQLPDANRRTGGPAVDTTHTPHVPLSPVHRRLVQGFFDTCQPLASHSARAARSPSQLSSSCSSNLPSGTRLAVYVATDSSYYYQLRHPLPGPWDTEIQYFLDDCLCNMDAPSRGGVGVSHNRADSAFRQSPKSNSLQVFASAVDRAFPSLQLTRR